MAVDGAAARRDGALHPRRSRCPHRAYARPASSPSMTAARTCRRRSPPGRLEGCTLPLSAAPRRVRCLRRRGRDLPHHRRADRGRRARATWTPEGSAAKPPLRPDDPKARGAGRSRGTPAALLPAAHPRRDARDRTAPMSEGGDGQRRWLYWLPALAVMALIFVLSSQSGLRVSEDAAGRATLPRHRPPAGLRRRWRGLLLALARRGTTAAAIDAAMAFVLTVVYGADRRAAPVVRARSHRAASMTSSWTPSARSSAWSWPGSC